MKLRSFIALWMIAAAITACASPPRAEVIPAVLASDAASHATLLAAVREAVNDRAVLLAYDALTHSSELILEPARARDASGRPMQGREIRAPEVFHLRKQGEECVLVHERTHKEFVLAGAKCEAAK